jgi:hypothetical protein
LSIAPIALEEIVMPNRIARPSSLLWIAAITLALFATNDGRAAAPVLVLNDDASANPYGDYLGEILRGEGISAIARHGLPVLPPPRTWPSTGRSFSPK